MDDYALTIDEACAKGHMSRASLYKYINSGELRAVKRGRRTFIIAAEMRRWIESLPAKEIPYSPEKVA